MKFNVLRAILIPWTLLFFLSLGFFVAASLKFFELNDPDLRSAVLYVGGIFCLFTNIGTLNKAGIWIADSLPYSIRRRSMNWFVRALIAVGVAGLFYVIGEAPWMPLFWQGFVIPAVFMICLFVIVRSMMGLILKKAAVVSFTRFFTVIMSLPLIYLVAMTSQFISQNFTNSYFASKPGIAPVMAAAAVNPNDSEEKEDEVTGAKVPEAVSKRAQEFQALAESGKPCSEQNSDIRGNLDTRVAEDIGYWAIKAVKCTDMKSIVILPRLADMMMKHKSPAVRAAAVQMMLKYNRDTVKPIAYLLIKYINEKVPKEVMVANASVLSKLGEEERTFAVSRLKSLLDSSVSQIAAEILVQNMRRPELVTNYVSENLATAGEARERAVAMICLLPNKDRGVATPFIADVTATVKSGTADDPAVAALSCLGTDGLKAIRQEVENPLRLPRPLAAQTLAEMDLKNDKETLKTVEDCLKDSDEMVRKACSQSMGKIGKLALPKILDLLKSSENERKTAGQLALQSLSDPEAQEDLRRARAENSGWMANQRKLQVAKAVANALVRIETGIRSN
jgi:HEAT repeat protein